MVRHAIVCLARTYNTASSEQRLALELAYVDRASLAVDLRVLVRAAISLVRSRGNIKARGRPPGPDRPARLHDTARRSPSS